MFRNTVFFLLLFSSLSIFAQFLSSENISNSSTSSSKSKMIFDNNYDLHITWIDSKNQIFYRFRKGEIWSEKILVYETDSTDILELSISSFHDTLSIFWIEKETGYKIKSVRLPDTTVIQLYESELILQNIESINNLYTNFIIWLEEDYFQDVNIMDLNNLDTLTLGQTLTPFSYSVCKDDSGKIFVFWLSGWNSLVFRSLTSVWSEPREILIDGVAQPLVEMDCIYNEPFLKFCFVFTGDIPTTGPEYSTDLFYMEGIDSTWSSIVSLAPPIQHCTNPQIEIYEQEYIIVLYQDGFMGYVDSSSKFYYTQKYHDHGFADTLFAPDSSTLNDFTSDGSRLYCSFAKSNDVFFGDIDIITPEVNKNDITNIYSFNLGQNYPNPFNPCTTIKYSIPSVGLRQASTVQLKIYNILGQEIATLVNQVQNSGSYQIPFDATSLPNGVYFYKLQYGTFTQSRKMIVLK